MKLPKILKRPLLPANLSESAKWLAGEGAGSWFVFEELQDGIQIKRYSPKGILECENLFIKPAIFSGYKEFSITYPSHCALVTIIQEGEKIIFSTSRKSI